MNLMRPYKAGLESHIELIETNSDLRELVKITSELKEHETELEIIEGAEGLGQSVLDGLGKTKDVVFPIVKRILGKGGELSLTAAKVTSKKAWSLTSDAFKRSSLLIKRRLDNNKYFLKSIIKELPDDEITIKISDLSKVSINGNTDFDILKSETKQYQDTMNKLEKHSKDIISYLDGRKHLLGKIKSSSSTADIARMLEALEEMKYPSLELSFKEGSGKFKETLIGGRVLSFISDDSGINYSMSKQRPPSGSEKLTFSNSEATDLMNSLIDLNDSTMGIKKSQDAFMKAVSEWQGVISKLSAELDNMNDLNDVIKKDIKKNFEIDSSIMLFYGDVYPSIGEGANSHIIGLSGDFAKELFN